MTLGLLNMGNIQAGKRTKVEVKCLVERHKTKHKLGMEFRDIVSSVPEPTILLLWDIFKMSHRISGAVLGICNFTCLFCCVF